MKNYIFQLSVVDPYLGSNFKSSYLTWEVVQHFFAFLFLNFHEGNYFLNVEIYYILKL